jgi:Ca2+-dependent lipid-binding protein
MLFIYFQLFKSSNNLYIFEKYYSEKSKRRTKTVANTNEPRWNQTFVYNGVRRSELRKRALEITVWDYARYEANDFLGEAVLELAVCLLDEEAEWHSLTAHGEHRHVRYESLSRMLVVPMPILKAIK